MSRHAFRTLILISLITAVGCGKTEPEQPVEALSGQTPEAITPQSAPLPDQEMAETPREPQSLPPNDDDEEPMAEAGSKTEEDATTDSQAKAEDALAVKMGQAEPIMAWAEQFKNIFRSDSYYFAGIPTEQGIRSAAADGVTVVISLLPDEQLSFVEFDLPAVLEELGVRYVRIPFVPDTFDKADVEHFAAILDETDGSVLTHCGSSNRVGALWAAYLYHYRDVEIEAAIEMGRSAGMRSDALVAAVRRIAAAP